MKMVKSLLLGSAAGLVAVTAGQAADLPVKAKPVEYVKVCSLYGAGFYYMPGTDMCLKVGGWVRVEMTGGDDNGNVTWGPYAGQENTRLTSNLVTRSRGYITADAREQTAYGTARAYIDVGISNSNTGLDNASNTFSSNRAFLQWAGITAGLTQSFYDFYSAPAASYRAGYIPTEDTGDTGWWVWAYTAQFGNGVSATVSAEMRRMSQVVGIGTTAAGGAVLIGGALLTAGAIAGLGYGGFQAPDVVANMRLDQTWGSAQVMAAVHEVNPDYYTPTTIASANGLGHPSDQWGFIVGAGLRLNFPMIAQGDYFQGEVNYTQGALKYINAAPTSNFEAMKSNQEGFGIVSDCVYGANAGASGAQKTGTACQLTTGWSVNASYEHYWAPQWHQSLVGAFEQVRYDSQANGILCSFYGGANGGGAGAVATAGPGNCNNDWSVWVAASRLQWDVTKSFYLGVEVLYEHLNTANVAGGIIPTALNLGPPGPATPTVATYNPNSWAFTARMHKDFLP